MQASTSVSDTIGGSPLSGDTSFMTISVPISPSKVKTTVSSVVDFGLSCKNMLQDKVCVTAQFFLE